MKIIAKLGLISFAFGICGCTNPPITAMNSTAQDPSAETAIINLLKGWNITDIHVSISNGNMAVEIAGIQEAKSDHDLSDETYAAAKKLIEAKQLRIHNVTVSSWTN